MFLSVIIPAYNEEKRLPETLGKIKAYLEKQSYDWEVLIVNDGSKDQTGTVVSELIKDWPGFCLIDNAVNKGKGGVVKQGMLEAKGDWRLFMDADNSTDISELEKLLKFANPKSEIRNLPCRQAGPKQYLNSNDQNSKRLENLDLKNSNLFRASNFEFRAYDIIIGSRYLKADSIKIKQPLLRRMVSRMGNWLIRILLGINMVDTQCGFKLFSAKAAEEIFPKQTIERWGFDMEILAIARKKGYQIKEVAVDWYDAEGSTVKKSAALKTLKELVLIKWNLTRGKYSSNID